MKYIRWFKTLLLMSEFLLSHPNHGVSTMNKETKNFEIVQKQPNNEIWYTSTDNNVITNFNTTSYFGSGLTLISNTYQNGIGVAKYSGDVTTIGVNAFYAISTLSSIKLPQSITNIGSLAFSNTGLISISIPNKLTSIGSLAFYNCKGLTSITIPDGVTSIGYCAFYNCNSLTNIMVSKKNTVYDSRNNCNAIINTSSNQLIHGCKNTIIPGTVTSIGDYAFQNCGGLTNITIPNSVTSIGYNAFYYCTGLTSVTIGSSVTSIGSSAFYYCNKLSSITCYATTAPSISSGTFSSVKSGGTLYYPLGSNYSLWLSSDYAYLGYVGWNSSEMHNEMVNVKNIQVITNPIGANTTNIKVSYILIDIEGIEYNRTKVVVIPENETGKDVSRTISVTDTEYTFDVNYTQSTEEGTQQNNEIWYTSTTGNIITSFNAADMFGIGLSIVSNTYKNGKGIAIYSDDITKINNNALYCCDILTGINIPRSVTSILTNSLLGCTNLTSIVVDSENTVYDSRDNCNAIIKKSNNLLVVGCKNTVIPNSVTSIGSSAFLFCRSLTNIEIPNSVTSIGDYAFQNCGGLTNITIPNSVTSIGNTVFSGCTVLSSIVVDSENTVYDSRDNCNAIIKKSNNLLVVGCKNTVMPNSVTSIGYGAFYCCTELTSITIGSGITSIGDRAFYCCNKLTNIVIPDNVTTIGLYAFQICTLLASVTIGSGVTSISNYAFTSCVNLSSITCLAETAPTIYSYTFLGVKTGGKLYYLSGSDYSLWLSTSALYLGYREWTGELIHKEIVSVKNIQVLTDPIYANTTAINISYILVDEKSTEYNRTKIVTIPINDTGSNVSRTVSVTDMEYTFDVTYSQTTEEQTQSNNEIWYTTSDGNTVQVNSTYYSGPQPISNIYSGGKGILTFENNVTNITEMFDADSNDSTRRLLTVNLPTSVTTIGNYTFNNCVNLTSVNIPDNVTTIGSRAFQNCGQLTSITIPNNVTSIGDYAFQNCSGMTSITCLRETAPTIYSYTFNNIKTGGTLYYPSGSDYSSWLSTNSCYLGYRGWNGEEMHKEIVSVKNIQILTNPIYANTTSINISYTLVEENDTEYNRSTTVTIPINETTEDVTRTVSVTDMEYTFDVEYTQQKKIVATGVTNIVVNTNPIYANAPSISVSYTLSLNNNTLVNKTKSVAISINDTGSDVSRSVSVTDMEYTFDVEYTQIGENSAIYFDVSTSNSEYGNFIINDGEPTSETTRVNVSNSSVITNLTANLLSEDSIFYCWELSSNITLSSGTIWDKTISVKMDGYDGTACAVFKSVALQTKSITQSDSSSSQWEIFGTMKSTNDQWGLVSSTTVIPSDATTLLNLSITSDTINGLYGYNVNTTTRSLVSNVIKASDNKNYTPFFTPMKGTGDFTLIVSFITPSTFTFYKRYGDNSSELIGETNVRTKFNVLVSSHGDYGGNYVYTNSLVYEGTGASSSIAIGRWFISVIPVLNSSEIEVTNKYAIMFGGHCGSTSASTWYYMVSEYCIDPNSKYIVALTRTDGVYKLYVNGKAVKFANNGVSGYYKQSNIDSATVDGAATLGTINLNGNGNDADIKLGSYERPGAQLATDYSFHKLIILNESLSAEYLNNYTTIITD